MCTFVLFQSLFGREPVITFPALMLEASLWFDSSGVQSWSV